MTDPLTPHPGDETLEGYSLARLDEQASAVVEEHLLLCENCQRRLTEFDTFVRATQAAARELQQEAAERAAVRSSWMPFSLDWRGFRVPKWAMAGSLAALLMVVAVPLVRQSAGADPQLVELGATRSSRPAGAVIEAGKPLALSLDVTGLELAGPLRVEVADSVGGTVETGPGELKGARVHYTVRKRLGRGQFWVRVYQSSGALASEMGLEAR